MLDQRGQLPTKKATIVRMCLVLAFVVLCGPLFWVLLVYRWIRVGPHIFVSELRRMSVSDLRDLLRPNRIALEELSGIIDSDTFRFGVLGVLGVASTLVLLVMTLSLLQWGK